jgi:hypothetical protein
MDSAVTPQNDRSGRNDKSLRDNFELASPKYSKDKFLFAFPEWDYDPGFDNEHSQ